MDQWMGWQFLSSLNQIGKATANKKFHFFQALLQPDALNIFCQLVAQEFLTKQLILFNLVEFFILCR